MGHVNFEVLKTDLLWYDLTSMIVFLLLKKNFIAKDTSAESAKIWEQWRWDLEGAGIVSLSEPLKDNLFRERFLVAIDQSIATVRRFGNEISNDYLNNLDDIWGTKYSKNYEVAKVNKCLADLKAAISSNYCA